MSGRKKTKYDPNQYSFFADILSDQFEKMSAENEAPGVPISFSTETRQLTLFNQPTQTQGEQHGARQTEPTSRHSEERSTGVVSEGSTNESGLYSDRIRNSGYVGVESSGGVEHTSQQVSGSSPDDITPPANNPEAGLGQRGSEADGGAGLYEVGNFVESRSRYPIANYRIKPDEIGSGSAKVKYADNIAAIKLLQHLQSVKAPEASPEEKAVLVRYVGWGGIPQAFDSGNKSWEKEYNELRALLPQDEYEKARRSTQDAHYTSGAVINPIYNGLERLGVKASDDRPLRILEPSAGIGNFIGYRPAGMNVQFVAIELDPVSAGITQYLYPEGVTLNTGFHHTSMVRGAFDAVIGNPPFGSQRLFDPEHPELKDFSVHNFFLAKSLQSLDEGGIGAFVVSRYFLDAENSAAREHIAGYADLLGAIRLPNTAFQKNALTEVTTDIVFFRRHGGQNTQSLSWIGTAEIMAPDTKSDDLRAATINKYFVEQPGQIIGHMEYTGGMFEGQLNCVAESGLMDLSYEINKRLTVLPQNQFIPRAKRVGENNELPLNDEFIASEYFAALKTGSFCLEPKSGKLVQKMPGEFGQSAYKPAILSRKNDSARITGLIQIRDSIRQLITAEKNDVAPEQIESYRRALNVAYDRFVKNFGYINSTTNRSVFQEDPQRSLIESLEVGYNKGISQEQAKRQNRKAEPASAEKAAIFRTRVLKPAEAIQRVDTAQDSLMVALRETGRVDFALMASLTNQPIETLQSTLEADNLIFLNPQNQSWEIKDKYLSGNIREKLHIAERAAHDSPEYTKNVEALRQVMPADIEPVDIGIDLGATWVPADIYKDFIEFLHDGNGQQTVNYLDILGKWEVKVKFYNDSLNKNIMGIPEYPASDLIEAIFKHRPIKIEKESGKVDSEGKPILVIDQELTSAAMQKANEIKQKFKDWVWEDDLRREALARIYNDRFNTHVAPSYDGSHLELVGASAAIKLRPHQKDLIWRNIQEGTGLSDHVVGAGKSMACIGTIMESKRMGFLNKPMVVVPNHLVYQWRDEFYKLYPGANILVAEKKDFLKENRERFFSRIATGEWDAVIVAHSSFKKIDMPRDTQELILKEQVDLAVSAIEAAKAAEGGRATIKQLEKQRESLQAHYDKLIAKGGEKDRAVDFSDLGVDALFVDESQEFKNLAFATSMNVAGLGNIAGSGKALDLFIKCRYLQMKQNGKGVYFLTGTPISNTIAEVFTLQRYLQYDELQNKGIGSFDAWASAFGKISAGWELDATGVNYKLKSRFASFQNVPELLAMYRSFADVVTAKDLEKIAKQNNLPTLTPPIKGEKPQNIVAERSPDQAEYMERIIHRMEHLPSDPRKDNPLAITNDARKAGLDFRVVDSSADDFAGSKVNAAVDNIYAIWRGTEQDRGTQLVFCDLSTPKQKNVSMSPAEEDIQVTFNDEIVESDDEGNDVTVAPDMDELVASFASTKFSVYDDIKEKLIARGIPAEEIVFIHEANTELRKSKLYGDVNAGRVRVLLGSTSKMGAGMNVQERLVAAHHLDAPWRPSDLEQRNGRIVRQGNKLYAAAPDTFKVGIFYYATKQTYDARMWQTIEYKAAAIEQFRKGDLLQRQIEDVASEAANAAEMKAAASGNPLILAQVQLASDLRQLEAVEVQFKRSQHRLKGRLKTLQSAEERYTESLKVHNENIAHLGKCTRMVTEKGKEKIFIQFRTPAGQLLSSDKSQAIMDSIKETIRSAIKDSSNKVLVGEYRGFKIHACGKAFKSGYFFTLTGTNGYAYRPQNLEYTPDDKFSLGGFFQRMDNFFAEGLPAAVKNTESRFIDEKAELNKVQSTLAAPFPQENELKLTRQNFNDVMAELQKMQNDADYVSAWMPAKELRQEPTLAPESPVDLSKNTHLRMK